MSAIGTWFKERIPIEEGAFREMTNEPVPNHLKHWWFCLGGTPAYLFVIQILTGILLAFYYQPSPSTAYESVRYITEEAAFGWFIRSVHKWAATLMIAALMFGLIDSTVLALLPVYGVQKGLDAGLLINVAAGNTIRLLPPLVINPAEAEELAAGVAGLIRDFS